MKGQVREMSDGQENERRVRCGVQVTEPRESIKRTRTRTMKCVHES